MPYWCVDYRSDKKGNMHPVLVGGSAFPTESAAQSYIDSSALSAKAEIFQTKTVNSGKAGQEIKAKLINRYKNLDQGMQTIYHDKKEKTSSGTRPKSIGVGILERARLKAVQKRSDPFDSDRSIEGRD